MRLIGLKRRKPCVLGNGSESFGWEGVCQGPVLLDGS